MTESLRLEGTQLPGENGTRIRVSLGVYLSDFPRINLREKSFGMAGLARHELGRPEERPVPGQREGRTRSFRPGQGWAPSLEFVNAIE